ncbi:MAG: GH92 family glycosyl hydrolase [Muribaculaceae bacterium]|nr:GH92 family glycosyl hydrolase [Muribaculaceae bacterium]
MVGYKNMIMICLALAVSFTTGAKVNPVDYVNPYMGNISHILQPTRPTVHRPNSMLRIYPKRGDHTETFINGLPVIVVNHRENTAFDLSATRKTPGNFRQVVRTDYDNEEITPYSYKTSLENHGILSEFSPSHRSALYSFQFPGEEEAHVLLNAGGGEINVDDTTIYGWQPTWGGVKVYIYMKSDTRPLRTGIQADRGISYGENLGKGDDACAILTFKGDSKVNLKYGISFISVEQAKNNLEKEIPHYDINRLYKEGRDEWNEKLGKIRVKGGDENDKNVFYTSLYRCYERPVNISEDGRYFSAADHKVHDDEGRPFYTDDWLWDTYRAAHPLRTLIFAGMEEDMIHSLVRTTNQSKDHWFPTFPSITGDSRRMNCNHGVAVVADAISKGLDNFDVETALEQCRGAIEDKTLAPWSARPGGWLNEFFALNGYVPALAPGEKEIQPDVNDWEKRQPVPVTLGTSYDYWCLSKIAEAIGRKEESKKYKEKSYNYRNLFNPETAFFHPKDKEGGFIPNFDYRFSGGQGAREYYAENNGWTYRWDVQHNIADLINLMGGNEKFSSNLDQTFDEWLGRSKYDFYSQLPDQTGNVGQFSMANEPSLHIPYLYNYAGQPWKTQKRVRDLIHQWFRNDLMGMPGDEDGGGMSAFVVLSMIGLYPVTPGLPIYNLSSPFFDEVTIETEDGKSFEIKAPGTNSNKKYIKSARLNGKHIDKPWIYHDEIVNGGGLVYEMSETPNKSWGSSKESSPPSGL